MAFISILIIMLRFSFSETKLWFFFTQMDNHLQNHTCSLPIPNLEEDRPIEVHKSVFPYLSGSVLVQEHRGEPLRRYIHARFSGWSMLQHKYRVVIL